MGNDELIIKRALNKIKMFCARYESCADCPLLQLDEHEDSRRIIQDYTPEQWTSEKINDVAYKVAKEMKR